MERFRVYCQGFQSSGVQGLFIASMLSPNTPQPKTLNMHQKNSMIVSGEGIWRWVVLGMGACSLGSNDPQAFSPVWKL